MSTLGKNITVKGEVHASEDLVVEGRIEGPVWCEDFALTLAASGEVIGDIVARDITIFGRANGQLLAKDVVDLRPEATVTGQVIAHRLILNEGARFTGRAEREVDVALRVAKFKQQKRTAPGANGPQAT
jgi:cytoskeletal protein CcmA (bactofilin family)